MPVPGAAPLGRGVVVGEDQPAPPAWSGAPRVVVDAKALAQPAEVVAALHEAWAGRQPVVIELGVDPVQFRTPVDHDVEPWTLEPSFEPWFDRLHFLVWANSYDARTGEPIWWWGRKAARLDPGAAETPDGTADVALADGRPAWVDGGPRTPFDPDELDGVAVVHAESVELGRLAVAPPAVEPSAELAPDQLAAVAHRRGPSRVIAPAGSGKTRVLTERLRHLVVDRGWERDAVLAVAYNVKARDEMQERCAAFGPRVQTLNGLAYQLLGRHRGSSPRVLEEREVRRLIDGLAPKRRARANTDPTAAYLEALTTVRLGLQDPADVEEERGDVPGLEALFDPYRRALKASGAVDFDEQIYGAVEALLTDGEFRAESQRRYRHLLVDEFQDLTPAHVLLLRLLAAPGLDVFGVGDDDQCIYGHARADPAFLIDFDRLFPAAGAHPLEVNYRCPEPVVTAARTLLSYNHRRVPKEIRPGPAAGTEPEAFRVRLDPAAGGATALVEEVQRWLAEPGVEPADIAVLARVNSLLLAPHVALAEAGVPIDSVLRTDVLNRTGLRAALAYLRIAVDPNAIQPDDLAEVYRRPSRGMPNWITKWFRGATSVSRVRAIATRLDDEKVAMKIEQLADDLALVVAAASDGTTRSVLTAIQVDVGLGAAMELLDRSKGGEGSTQLDDLEALLQVADLHPEAASFEPWLRSVFHREAEDGGVALSTIHRVKGREWPRVALFGASAGLLPHRLSVDVEEERRVLHVGITRGRDRVVVLADANRPSPFLAELDGSAEHRPADQPDPAAGRTAGAGPARAIRSSSAPGEPLSGPAAVIDDALRTWRRERSKADGVAAFIVASNATLAAIARAQPKSMAELARIPGIGPAKLDLYGDEILAILEDMP